jgi:hypothetical protein
MVSCLDLLVISPGTTKREISQISLIIESLEAFTIVIGGAPGLRQTTRSKTARTIVLTSWYISSFIVANGLWCVIEAKYRFSTGFSNKNRYHSTGFLEISGFFLWARSDHTDKTFRDMSKRTLTPQNAAFSPALHQAQRGASVIENPGDPRYRFD